MMRFEMLTIDVAVNYYTCAPFHCNRRNLAIAFSYLVAVLVGVAIGAVVVGIFSDRGRLGMYLFQLQFFRELIISCRSLNHYIIDTSYRNYEVKTIGAPIK